MLNFIKINSIHFLKFILFFLIMCASPINTAAPSKKISLHNEIVIDSDTTFENVVLDLAAGSFLVRNNATLTIKNCTINNIISPDNPYLIKIIAGKLVIDKTILRVTTTNIMPTPNDLPAHYLISITNGALDIQNSQFSIDALYRVGLVLATNQPMAYFVFKKNNVYRFHGGILFNNINHAIIEDNKFEKVSSSNIFILNSNDHSIRKNKFLFAGNGNNGDAIDIFDSKNIVLAENDVLSGFCYGLYILNSENVSIEKNHILNGITYAIFIAGTNHLNDFSKKILEKLNGNSILKNSHNINIAISNNYIAQNRYGLAVNDTLGLNVTNNIFMQRFDTDKNRKFWTDNTVLFKNTTDITWDKNLYKESYGQGNDSDNTKTVSFAIFPAQGGVTIPSLTP